MKIIGTCFPDYVYPTNTTTWSGFGIWHLMGILRMIKYPMSQVSIVTKLHPSNVTHPLIQTVADGAANALPVYVGMTHLRNKLVRFSCPVSFTDTVIISKSQTGDFSGDFVSNTFDRYTMMLILVSTLAISTVSWAALRFSPRHKRGVGFVEVLLYTSGNSLGVGLPDIMRVSVPLSQKVAQSVHGLAVLILSKSFSGLIIASLLSKTTPPRINTLWDVAGSPHLKIITAAKGTYWHEDLMSHPATDEALEKRIEIREELLKRRLEDVEAALSDVMAGTHILFGHESTLHQLTENSPTFSKDQFFVSPPIKSRQALKIRSATNH